MITVEVRTMWWCPTCPARVPQPRWMNMRKPNQLAYHVARTPGGDRMHQIEKVPVLDGELVAP